MLFGLTTAVANATVEPLYIAFYFNMHSINQAITDKQCEEIFNMPNQYTIVNDNVIYKENPNYTLSNYHRTNVTYLSQTQYLFTGSATITFNLDGKLQTSRQESAAVLSIPEQKIQGSVIIDGYCKGNWIGTNQNSNQWPPA